MKGWLIDNNHERLWFLIAFVVGVIFLYSITKIMDNRSHYYDDPNAQHPDEYEMRGGDIY